MRWKLPFAILLVACATAAWGETLAPGATMPGLTLADQHDVAGSVDTGTRLIIFTADMDASDHVKEALAENGAQRLAAAGAVWVANISRMPGIITKLFALPSLRKRPYRMLLDRDGKATADLPRASGRVTLLYLEDLKIARIDYADSPEQVTAALSANVTDAGGDND
jgi:hypothetical protein